MSTNIHIAVDLDGNYGRGVLQGAATYALERPGWRVLPMNLHALPSPGGFEVGMDGLVIQGTTPRLLGWAERRSVPVVNVSGILEESPYPRVISDDRAIGRLAAEHFLEAHLSAFARSGVDRFHFSKQRLAGFTERLVEAGMPVTDLTQRGLKYPDKIRRLLEELPRPVGVFCFNDIRARTLFVHLKQWGCRIPDEVALLGVDNDELSAWISGIGLSSVKPDAQRIGYLAARSLHQRMRGETVAMETLVPPIRVEVRGSSDTIGLADPALRRALTFIRGHAVEGIGVDDVAREAGVSRRILEMRFRKNLDRSVGGEIKRQRLAHGAVLLRQSDLSVDDIAAACGYSEASPFSTAFRRRYGQSPRAFRRSRTASLPDSGR